MLCGLDTRARMLDAARMCQRSDVPGPASSTCLTTDLPALQAIG